LSRGGIGLDEGEDAGLLVLVGILDELLGGLCPTFG